MLNSAVDVSFTHFAVLLSDSIHENPEIGQKPCLKGVRPGYWPCWIMLSLPRGGRDFFGPAVVLQGRSCGLGGRHMAQIRKISSKFQLCDYGNQIDKKLTRSCCSKYVSRAFPHRTTGLRSLADIWDETFCNKMYYKSLQYMSTHVNTISKHPDTAVFGEVCQNAGQKAIEASEGLPGSC